MKKYRNKQFFFYSFTHNFCIFSIFQVAKLLATNVGTIQQDLSILLKDESIEVSKQVIFSNPKYGVHLLTNYS